MIWGDFLLTRVLDSSRHLHHDRRFIAAVVTYASVMLVVGLGKYFVLTQEEFETEMGTAFENSEGQV